ncbi:tRNA-dihydrouridine(20) synthase [NAD(P)+]-like [Actinomortierella wolfii]|nr:tRNA-dihydrouridine(20) synthase [NAD(P)+]-like [Actinomortierella wolfii]
MVRVGTLPTRLLALEFGADLVYTPEVVDLGIIGAERVVNEDNGTIDYLVNGNVVFRTHPSEKDRLVFQIGSANPDTALQAALTVAKDVSTIDLNCGCPKRFSVHGGMGAALMEDPDKLCAILKNLVDNSGLPVTCKIRIFPDVEKTLTLVKRIVATGIKALAVHCRYRDERPRDPGHWDRFQAIVNAVDIPVIANGDVMTYDDIARIRAVSGAAGVMIARGAELNVSVFRPEGALPLIDVVRMYVRKCMQTRNIVNNTKYVLMQMFKNDTKSHYYQPLTRAKTFRAICQVFEMEHELDEWQASQAAKGFPTEMESLRPNHQHASVPTIMTTVKENGKALTATEQLEMEQTVTTTTLKRKAEDDKEEKASSIEAISSPKELVCEHHPNKHFKQVDGTSVATTTTTVAAAADATAPVTDASGNEKACSGNTLQTLQQSISI